MNALPMMCVQLCSISKKHTRNRKGVKTDDRYFGFYADTGGSGNGDAAFVERQTPMETLTRLGTRTPAIVQM